MSKFENASEILAELKKPFPASDHKERKLPGGKKWLYLSWMTIRDRLDELFPLDWEASYSDPVVVADYMVVRCRLTILISQGGITREGVGNDKAYPELNDEGRAKIIGTPPERARADAFRSAAEEFGIAAYLNDQKFVAAHLQRQGDGRGVRFMQENDWREVGAMGSPKKPIPINNGNGNGNSLIRETPLSDISDRIAQAKQETGLSNQDIQRIASSVLGRAIASSKDIKTEQECILVLEAMLRQPPRS